MSLRRARHRIQLSGNLALVVVLGANLVFAIGCATSPRAEAARAGATDPTNERDRAKQAAFEDAIRGLEFATGLVVVTDPPPMPDVDLARQLKDHGRREMDANHRTRALRTLAGAVRADPNDPEAYFLLGRAMVYKGKIEHAKTCFRTVLEFEHDDVEARNQLALAFARLMRFQEAIEQMNRALSDDPALEGAHSRLAIWHYYLQQYDDAWRHTQLAQRAGSPPPAQFVHLLTQKMAAGETE